MRTRATWRPTHLNPSRDGSDSRAQPIRDLQECCASVDEGESTAKYLFNLSNDVILSLDRLGNIVCINQRGVQMSGYSISELRGANLFELLLVPEDRPVAREVLQNLIQGKAQTYELRWKTKDGGIVHFDAASVPRFAATGEFLSTVCTQIGRAHV